MRERPAPTMLSGARRAVTPLHPFVDLHLHALPGVDNGPASWSAAVELCVQAAHNGITHAVLTPHFRGKPYAERIARLSSRLIRLRESLTDRGLVLQVALGKRKSVKMFGDDYDTIDGTCVRDYIHIVDLAQAHILALQALEKGNCVYNLGNGAGYSVKQVIETAREITGHEIPADIAPRRAGDPAILVGGSEKIKRELGWQPRYPELRAIIESAWRWHQAHPDGYGD